MSVSGAEPGSWAGLVRTHAEGHARIADTFFSCYFNTFDQPMVTQWWIITSIRISGKKNLVVLGPSRSHPKSKE
jgi:hypothetical protein